jgi:hypothetical protein
MTALEAADGDVAEGERRRPGEDAKDHRITAAPDRGRLVDQLE